MVRGIVESILETGAQFNIPNGLISIDCSDGIPKKLIAIVEKVIVFCLQLITHYKSNLHGQKPHICRSHASILQTTP